MRHTTIVALGLAAAMCSPLAHATSPDLPVVARIEAGSRLALDGTSKIRLVIESRDEGEYVVTVRRPAAVAGEGKAMEMQVAYDLVRDGERLVVDDAVVATPDEVVTVRYEVELESVAGGYRGLVVVSQAFAVGQDGSLEAIDFEEQMRREGADVQLADGESPAGGASPQPE